MCFPWRTSAVKCRSQHTAPCIYTVNMPSCRMLTLIRQLEVVFLRFLHSQIIIFPSYTILLKKVTLHSSYIRCGHKSSLTETLNMCVCVSAKSLQSRPTPCIPTDCSLTGSSVHGILQARILEWVAMPSSRGSSWPRDRTWISWVSCIGRWVLYH